MEIGEVLAHYFSISSFKIKRFPLGLINETYQIFLGGKSYVLQRMNPIFGTEVIQDLSEVAKHLEKSGIIWQSPIVTREGELWVTGKKGSVWRLMNFVPGVSYEKILDRNMAHEAGRILGRFHSAMSNFDYQFQNPRPPAHQSEKVFSGFCEYLEKVNCNERKELEQWIYAVRKMPEYFLTGELKETVVHGDPKTANIIFTEQSKEKNRTAVAMIDLDGSMRNKVLVELGDAFRSWCSDEEDEPANRFDMDKFKSALIGYLDGSHGDFLTREEVRLLPRAIKLITLELASRFLKDYFEDRYFGWNGQKYSNRKEHNLARIKGQVSLFFDLCEKEKEVDQFLSEVGIQSCVASW